MSGGSLNYFFGQLEDHIGDFGDRELDDLVEDLANLFYEREWYLSGDTCVGDWREARDKFKSKWFTDIGRQNRIDKYLDEVVVDIKDSLGMLDEYCGNCAYWMKKDESNYGVCPKSDGVLRHMKERCGEWVASEAPTIIEADKAESDE